MNGYGRVGSDVVTFLLPSMTRAEVEKKRREGKGGRERRKRERVVGSRLAITRLESVTFIVRLFHMNMLKAHYIDQFNPSGPEAHISAFDSRFNVVHVCCYPFCRPQKEM